MTIIRKDGYDEFNAIIEAGYFRTTSIKCWVALGIYLFVSPITVTYHDKHVVCLLTGSSWRLMVWYWPLWRMIFMFTLMFICYRPSVEINTTFLTP